MQQRLGLTRRRLLQLAGLTGVGVGTSLMGKAIVYPHPKGEPTPFASRVGESITTTFEFDQVKVNARGQTIDRHRLEGRVLVFNLGNDVPLEMVAIPGGSFLMGSPETEAKRDKREGPQHSVTVKPFLMGKYPVTQAQWLAIAKLPQINRPLKPNPSGFPGENRPVENVSWLDAVEYCARLSRLTQQNYRLPTEAEWEYACRAGTTTPFHFGETLTTDLANYRGKDWISESMFFEGSYGQGPEGVYRSTTTDVGYFQVANAFGLYDMHGNVLEWCADHWHDSYQNAPNDGSAWIDNRENELRVLRGGSWLHGSWDCRSAYRIAVDTHSSGNNVASLRVVCSGA